MSLLDRIRSPGTMDLSPVGALASVMVLAGGLLVAPVGRSVWLASVPLRHTETGEVLGVTLGLCGLGILAAAWLGLWRRSVAGRIDLAVVRRTSAAWAVPLLLAPPLFSRDGWSYVAQGQLTRIGLSPYVFGPGYLPGPLRVGVDPLWWWTPTPYGPLPLIWGSCTSALIHDPWLLVVAERVLTVLGLVLLAWAVPHLARATGRDPAVASALALPTPLMLAHGVGGLHNDVLMIGLAAAGLALALRHGWVLGSLVVGLAASVKFTGVLACLGVALATLPLVAGWRQRVWRLAMSCLLALGTVYAVGQVSGLGLGWVRALDVPTTVQTPLSMTTVLQGVVPDARAVGVALAFALVAALALRAPTGTPALAVTTTAVAFTGTVLLSPVVQPWYALWALPLLAACRLGPRGDAVLVWVTLTLGVTAPLDSSMQGVVLVLVGGVVAVLTRQRRGEPDQSVTPSTSRSAAA